LARTVTVASWSLVALLAVFAFASACYHLAPRRADARAPRVYAERCSHCHGAAGRGDGLAGRALDPRPRDYADGSWQAAISDDEIRATIRGGGAARGRSAAMPAHADLSDVELDALVAYVRAVGGRSER
jgi:mono/diheme cytochrome c family protein